MPVDGIAMLERFHQPFVAADYRVEVRHQYNAQQQRHGIFVQVFPYLVADKQQLGFGVVDNVVYVVSLEFVKYGDNDCTIGQGCKKGHGPMCTVASANGNLIAGLNVGTFQYDVEFGYFPGNIFVLQCGAFIICQGISVPVLYDALLNVVNELLFLFHLLNRHTLVKTVQI